VVTAPYSENVEAGAPGWAASSGWSQTSADNHTSSGAKSFWYDQTGGATRFSLASPDSGDLTSPPVYVPAGADHYLRFWYSYDTEDSGLHWDQRWVQISVDGGPFQNRLQLANDPANTWLQSPAVLLDAPTYGGHTIQVRFHFETIDDRLNDHKGWYIDDFSITADPPPACADANETGGLNDTSVAATPVAYNVSLPAQICAGGDVDYYRFEGKAGDQVGALVQAQSAGSRLDPTLFLLDGDGSSILASGDDQVLYELTDSQLAYTLPRDGVYYLKVRAWDHPSAGGSDYTYTLHLFEEKVDPVAEITFPSGNHIPGGPVTITVSASDAGSGVSHVQFKWHSGDWSSSDWVDLGADWDGSNGWSIPFDSAAVSPDADLSFYALVYDRAGNWIGAGVWDVMRVNTLSFIPFIHR
jgi:hypothetical protein